MRRKVTCTVSDRVGDLAAMLIARLDLADVVLVGGEDGDPAHDLTRAGEVLGFAPRVSAGGWEQAAGSDVVVLADAPAGVEDELTRRSPGAVVVVATERATADVARLLDATLFPRGRMVGVPGAGPYERAARAAAIVDAILRDRHDRVLGGAVLCRGDDQDVQERAVRLGAAGVVDIVQHPPGGAASAAPAGP
jgi:hypothetical protein